MSVLTRSFNSIRRYTNYNSLKSNSDRNFNNLTRQRRYYNSHRTRASRILEASDQGRRNASFIPPTTGKGLASQAAFINKCIHTSTRTSVIPRATFTMQKRRKSTDCSFDVESLTRWKSPEYTISYTRKDAILYALGVSVDVTNPNNLKYVYEDHPQFSVLPTYGCVLAQIPLLQCGAYSGGIPNLPINLEKVLHGEQWLFLHRELPAAAKTKSRIEIADIMDKASGAVVLFNVSTELEGGEKLLDAQFNIFVVGSGGFGGKRTSEKAKPLAQIPSSEPDEIVTVGTNVNQAALYRLSGDLNPLHIDPGFAAKAGFSTPILHGLCTMGSAVTSVIQKYPQRRLRECKARFAKPVFPGNHLRTEVWLGEHNIRFRTKVKETGELALTGCHLVFE